MSTKDQFNSFECLWRSPDARYVVDEAGFVLYDADPSSSLATWIAPGLGVEQSVIACYRKVKWRAQRPTTQTEKGTYKVPRRLLGRGGRGFVCWRL